ncbi:GDSL esterase/lipase At5g03600 isoform X2 [Brachypodium distachyon]|uniref:SGNH hydrolase-type esterase domain-containing protein n=1 Tax=Brachypodium distachyon TaxID=15368 RepID=A0A0Q3S725_BRADI|nr:GDSL esterase/lipase At5g03600 isoform X2 [Brachypodium distachyon]KQK20906.1 hypothetical protein BRADI_1g57440v3 [Brachypodium distachyon]|eukprot:XP_024313320.1 GDSL esterase/lipase At5g03600 isoform X2 [Brachypodium distachyon]
MKIVSILVLFFVTFNAARVDSRPNPDDRLRHLFVFGDSFGDNGNTRQPLVDVVLGTDKVNQDTRQWFFPYGSFTDGREHPTGRFSNYMVQSDLVANIMGLAVAPPAYKLTKKNTWDKSGMTFAVGGTNVFQAPTSNKAVPTLRDQVDRLESLIVDGTISRKHVQHSVALIAISGNDYVLVGDAGGMNIGIGAFVKNVSTEIVSNVQRLQEMGVAKVLVNNIPPIGCAPSQTMPSGFARCDRGGNNYASVQNRDLKRQLRAMDDVHIIDLHTAFTNIVEGENTEVSSFFDERLAPCCKSTDPSGYCGQMGDSDSDFRYTLCKNADKYFYWDEMNPTQAGWEIVMEQLEDPIKKFLELN